MSDSKIQNYTDTFFEENGKTKFKEKIILRFDKLSKCWQAIKVLGILEEIFFENKDKKICREFVNENIKNNL